jgi:hypothetical protein
MEPERCANNICRKSPAGIMRKDETEKIARVKEPVGKENNNVIRYRHGCIFEIPREGYPYGYALFMGKKS